MQRDYESIIQVTDVDTISITASAAVTTLGTAIDTQGLRGIVFTVEPDEAIGTDDVTFEIHECATAAGTYAEIDTSKYLPTSAKLAAARKVTDAASGLIQTFACTSNLRYIKPAIDPTTVADDITFSVTVIKFPELVDAGDLGPADSLP